MSCRQRFQIILYHIVYARQMKQSADWQSGTTVLFGFSVGKQTLLQVDNDTRS